MAPTRTRGTHNFRGRGFGSHFGRRGTTRFGSRHSMSGNASSTPPSAAYSQTLQFITSLKLKEMEKERAAYETHATVLQQAEGAGDDLLAKLEILIEGVRSWSGSGALRDDLVVGGSLSLENLDMWLLQAKYDPGFSRKALETWVEALETHIRHSMVKFDTAKLTGSLFTEWLSSGDSITAQPSTTARGGLGTSSDAHAQDFVEVGRKEMHEQLEQLKSIIFESAPVDTDVLRSYLEGLFPSDESHKVLKDLRRGIDEFCHNLRTAPITVEDIRWSIESLLAADLMLPEKRATLREFTENPTVLEEIANVLNMRLGSLGAWAWPVEGMVVDMRRALNGKYRAFTDPDILDALFLQYLGIMWQVELKERFRSVFRSEAWKPSVPALSRVERERRQYFLKESTTQASQGVEARRREIREQEFLAGKLASDVRSVSSYDRVQDDDPSQNDGANASPAHIKQQLLYLMTTDCYLNAAIHGTHTVLRTDLEWFGPSLLHDAILTVLQFFGVTEEWLAFFKVFLEAPLRFSDDTTEVRVRKRGTPISYALSAVCGEAILFGMDLAVNQHADGLFLYRIHDDLWFWDAKPERCVAGWKEMQKYASLVGLKFNQGKTGSASIGEEARHPDLPDGDIRWGFLKFDPTEKRFIIDQKQVDEHIIEFRRQLSSTRSVLGWVNAYNKYLAFIGRNFGKPAVCFGTRHISDITHTFARIQQEIIADSSAQPGTAGVIEHLSSLISTRFGIKNLPQGYFYWPIANGGLGLLDPIIDSLAILGNFPLSPENMVADEIRKDDADYAHLKREWEQRPDPYSRYASILDATTTAATVEFMSFAEYISQRITCLSRWSGLYLTMLEAPRPREPQVTPAMTAALGGVKQRPRNAYERWIFGAHGEEIIRYFGSLEAVQGSLIPVGLVQLYQTSRLKWEQ